MILAQTGNYSSTDSTLLTVKRWIGQSTLSHPNPVNSVDFHAKYWLAALAFFVLLGLLYQGPRRFLSGLSKWSVASAVIRSGINRLKDRMVLPLALVGLLLTSWTTTQFINYSDANGTSDLALSLRTKTIPVFSLELGFLSALVPMRDLTNLADVWPIVMAASVISFYFLNKMQFMPRSVADSKENRARSLSQVFWVLSAIWLIYRLVVGTSAEGGLPLQTGAFVDALLEPGLMLFLDSILLAWVITEIRDSSRLEQTDLSPRVPEVFALLPAVSAVNFLLVPSRYMAHFIWILWNSIATTSMAGTAFFVEATTYFIWAVSEGLILLQILAYPMIVLLGACLNGSLRDTRKIAAQILRNHAATVFLILVFIGVIDVAGVAIINSTVLSHPRESWVLLAADSYSHYYTLFSGLLLLAALIEIGISCELEIIASSIESRSDEAMINPDAVNQQ